MIHIQIDPSSGIPVYRQIMDQVKYYVASGALSVGAALPSIRELSKTLSVNPSTVVKAYNELGHEGVIEMLHGKGVFVTGGPSKISAKEMRENIRRIARQLVVEARQMKAPRELVLGIVKEEWDGISSR
jgi:GntR family transcriptional regulator